MCSTTKLRIYSQNVRKNYALVDTFLESQKDHYDIFFVQEPPWNFIRYALSTVSLEGDKVVLLFTLTGPRWSESLRTLRTFLELWLLSTLASLDSGLV